MDDHARLLIPAADLRLRTGFWVQTGQRPLIALAAIAFLAANVSAARADEGIPPYAQSDGSGAPIDAGQPPDESAPNDTAGPSVARVAIAEGNVSVKRGDSNDGVAASPNAPLLAADYLSTGSDGRAEVQFDGISLLRLDENTQVRFANLDQGHREAQLAEGTVELRELQGADDRPQIDTPSVSVQPRSTGRYLITVTPDGTTTVTVRSGSAAIITPSGAQTIGAGQSYAAQGSADSPNVQGTEYAQSDDFDAWNSSRDHVEEVALSQQDFNPAVDGDELSSYGDWQDVPSYGRVWHPYEEAGWAPYHDGRWVWEDAYGWTWVAAEPWGWAPYHYGRWFYNAGYGGWNWTPPPFGPHYGGPGFGPAFATNYGYGGPAPLIWRPALVSFFGFGFGGGGGFSLSVGFGNVGWVALAPDEIYHPWYGYGNGWHGGGYGNRYGSTTINNTTINNVTNVTNINYGTITKNYANANAPGAIASVDTRRFLTGNYRPTSVSPETLRTANVGSFRGPLPLAPTRQNLAFSPRAINPEAFHPIHEETSFAGHAPVARRYDFATQRREITTTLRAQNLPVEPRAFANAGVSAEHPYGENEARPALAGSERREPTSLERTTPESASPTSAWQRFNGQRVTPSGESPARPSVTYGEHASPSTEYRPTTETRSPSEYRPSNETRSPSEYHSTTGYRTNTEYRQATETRAPSEYHPATEYRPNTQYRAPVDSSSQNESHTAQGYRPAYRPSTEHRAHRTAHSETTTTEAPKTQ